MNQSKHSIELFGAVKCGSFRDTSNLSVEIGNFIYQQLYEELDCGFSSLDANWVAVAESISELSKKMEKEARINQDEDFDCELIKIKVSLDMEIIRKGG